MKNESGKATQAARLLGRHGGAATRGISTAAKAAAARENGKLGGRPRKNYLLCFESHTRADKLVDGGYDFQNYEYAEEEVLGFRPALERAKTRVAELKAAKPFAWCLVRDLSRASWNGEAWIDAPAVRMVGRRVAKVGYLCP
jgi:hypothetical protein